jgi:GT2 family glycosyltransferase
VLSVIIINYNVKYFLEQCLHAVYKAGRNIAMEVIVVDNNSTDGSRAYLEPLFPWVQFYWNPKNDGFSKACNHGAAVAKGSFVLFLNPDTIVPEDCFEKCIAFFEAHTNAGAIGVRMIDGSGIFLKESKRGFPSVLTSFFKLTGFAALFPASAFFARYYLGNLDEHSNHKVDVLSGAFMMVRKQVLDITGGFDERFFMYGEDIDLSYAIQKAGYENYYYAGTTIIHFKGESTQKESIGYVKLFYKAMLIFVQKHYGGSSAFVYNIFIQAAIIVRAGLAAFTNGIPFIKQSVLPKNKNTNAVFNNEHICLVGFAGECDAARLILKRAGLEKNVGDNVVYKAEESDVVILLQINELIKNKPVHRIVFCEGALLYSQIIYIMQQLPASVQAMIYAFKSNSIVGSMGRNNRGVTIPEE